jgi:hypothetical protein
MSNQPMPRTIDPTCYIASLLITIQVKQKNCGGYYEHRHKENSHPNATKNDGSPMPYFDVRFVRQIHHDAP